MFVSVEGNTSLRGDRKWLLFHWEGAPVPEFGASGAATWQQPVRQWWVDRRRRASVARGAHPHSHKLPQRGIYLHRNVIWWPQLTVDDGHQTKVHRFYFFSVCSCCFLCSLCLPLLHSLSLSCNLLCLCLCLFLSVSYSSSHFRTRECTHFLASCSLNAPLLTTGHTVLPEWLSSLSYPAY